MLASGIISAVAGLCLLVSPIGQSLVELSYDLPFCFRADIPVSEAVIVYLDAPSHQALDQPYTEIWDRALYGELVRRLQQLHAKAVVFDMLFDRPGTNDAPFIAAMRDFGKVAVAAIRDAPHNQGGGAMVWKPILPIEPIQQAAAYGMSEESTYEDLMMRRHFRSDLTTPSLAWRAAELTLWNGNGDLPAGEPAEERWINFYGPPLWLPHYSFYQVISNAVPAAAISNKVVFVGARVKIGLTGGKGADDFRTPYSRWLRAGAPDPARSPGVEITATTYLNLARQDWLTRTPRHLEHWLCLLFGLACGAGLAVCRPMTATGLALAGAVAIAGAAMGVVWHYHVWFPWFVLAGAQIPCALGLSVLAYTRRLLFEKQVLAATLAVTRSAHEARTKTAPALLLDPGPQPLPGPLGASLSSFFNSPGAAGAVAPGRLPLLPQAALVIPDHALIRCIGRGAYGEVWLARDIIGTYHAVKIVHRASFKEAAPFDREFNGLKRFTPISRSHPGFVHILHVGRNDELGCLYYIMEVGDDETAGQTIDPDRYSPKNLARELKRRGRLSFAESMSLSMTLADALHYLHTHQLIHRDIKPSNIIFVNGTPKFADIGLVTGIADGEKSVTVVGTPNYIPPEGPGTPAADVYSLGKLIYEASMGLDSGQFPDLPGFLLEGDGEPELFKLNNIIVRACEPDRRRRFQTARELLDALEQLQASLKSN